MSNRIARSTAVAAALVIGGGIIQSVSAEGYQTSPLRHAQAQGPSERAGTSLRECDGRQILRPGHCAGDEMDGRERQLAALINQYRADYKLSAIALSPALSVVANRHVRDLAVNTGHLTHDWSNCPMARGGDCMWKAPQVLGTGYKGNGYENAYGSSAGRIDDVAAVLHSWKEGGHGPHNDVILNKKQWQNYTWRAMGIGIYRGYAVMWVGAN